MKLPLSTDDATESLTGNEINVGGAVGDAIIGLALASASADTVDQAATINQKHKKDGNHSPDKDLPSASILSKKRNTCGWWASLTLTKWNKVGSAFF